MKLFNDFQSYQLNFSGCYLDYFKLIIIHFNHFMQFRETLITVQNQTAHCQIIIRFRQVEPESLIYLSISRRAESTYSRSPNCLHT